MTRPCSPCLKYKLHRELDHAIIALEQSAVSADVGGYLPEVRGITVLLAAQHRASGGALAGCERVQVIGKVEGFRAHLKGFVFPDRKVSRKGQIQLKHAGSLQIVQSQIAVGALRDAGRGL